MDDDFNTGGAIGILYELLTALNRFADVQQLEGGKASATSLYEFRRGVLVLRELGHILGLFREPVAAPPPARARTSDTDRSAAADCRSRTAAART